MTGITIAIAAGTMLVLAIIMSYILGWANKAFHVEVDPLVEAVLDALPGANCGGCGFLGCSEYAVAVVVDNAPVNKCPVGGDACAQDVAAIMGVEVTESVRYRPVIHCGAHLEDRLGKTEYRGEARCAAANLVAGIQGCTFGCLGLGDCVRVCNYDAIYIEDGLAVVDYERCVGCSACVKACPRSIIDMDGFKEDCIPTVTCSNKDKAKDAKAVCTTSCIGCRACTKFNDNFSVADNLARFNGESYAGEMEEDLLKAIKKCPTNSIHFVGKGEKPDIKPEVISEVTSEVKQEIKTE